jgi:hypothetical protein
MLNFAIVDVRMAEVAVDKDVILLWANSGSYELGQFSHQSDWPVAG